MTLASTPQNTTAPPARLWLGYFYGICGTTLFASKSVLIKLFYEHEADALLVLVVRMIFAVPFYVVIGTLSWLAWKRAGKPSLSPILLLQMAGVGALGYYLASYLDFVGLLYISAQFERLILYTYPLFVMIFGAMFFGGRITGYGLMALAIAYSGIAVIFWRGFQDAGDAAVLGTVFVVAAAFAFAFYQLFSSPMVKKAGSGLFTSVAMGSVGIVVFTQYILMNGFTPPDMSREAWFIGFLIGIFATVLPSYFLSASLGAIGAQATAMMGTVSPVATIALAIVILGEPFTFFDAVGTLLVLGGVGFFTLADMRRKKVAPAPHPERD